MNVNGVLRGYMSKSMAGEKFFYTVANTIEKQLKEWDVEYEVLPLKFRNFELIVNKGNLAYRVPISEQELTELQGRSPFSLDAKIWRMLQSEGLPIIRGYGNYINYCIQ